jgi:hypothetical protein
MTIYLVGVFLAAALIVIFGILDYVERGEVVVDLSGIFIFIGISAASWVGFVILFCFLLSTLIEDEWVDMDTVIIKIKKKGH